MILLLTGLLAHADDVVTVRLHVPEQAAVTATAQVRWLGQDRAVPLTATETPGELAATLTGEAVRMLPILLDVQTSPDAPPERVYRGIEMLPAGGGELVYSMDDTDPLRVHRIASTPAAGRDALATREGALIGGGLAWGAAMLLLVGALLWRAPTKAPQPGRDWTWWWSLPIWALLSVLWTWPAVSAGGGIMIGRHFDLPGVLWALDASGRLLSGGLQDTLTAWPVGGDYRRFDSFTLLPIGALFSDPGADRLHGALQVVGVFLLGVFGERFARAVGAKGWWGLVGGAALALSGLSANVLLEGHVFHLLNPWLPLLGLTWWRACGEQSRPLWGVLSGLLFMLCLLTTAYIGATAAVLVACFAVPALRDRRTWPAMGAAAAAVAVLMVPYTLLFTGGADIAPGSSGHIVSANLVSLSAPTPELDRSRHSQALSLPGLLLAMALLTPVLLRGRHRVLLVTAGITALLAMGAGFSASEGPPWFPLPMALVEAAGGGAFLRFPMRLFWGTLLCVGALAAWGGTALEARLGRGVRVLVLIALVEPFLLTRAPLRQQTQLSTTPSVYRQVDGPILDMFPDGTTEPHELEQWFTRFACAYQRSHNNPIAEHCTATTSAANPRYRLNRWVVDRLLEGEPEEARMGLAKMGFVGLAMHADLFESGDRQRLLTALQHIDPAPKYSTDGGELIYLYRISPRSADRATVYANLRTDPPRSLGMSTNGVGIASLQVEVETPDIERESNYLAIIRPPGHSEQTIELHNDGRVPHDLPDDIAWVGFTRQSLPAEFELRLVRRGRDAQDLLWSGPVRLNTAHERLVFRIAEDGSARPIAAAPAFTSPPVGRYNPTIAIIGWSVIAVLAGLLSLLLRRRSSAL